jgi:hypothetical protein
MCMLYPLSVFVDAQLVAKWLTKWNITDFVWHFVFLLLGHHHELVRGPHPGEGTVMFPQDVMNYCKDGVVKSWDSTY